MLPTLQLRALGAVPWMALAIFGLWAVSLLLSAGIAVMLFRGYRSSPENRNGAVLLLAVGILLLTTVPEFLRVGIPTATSIGAVGRSVIVSGFELLGLGSILWAIYGGGER